MGFRKGDMIRPTWTTTLGNMIDDYHGVAVGCGHCGSWQMLSVADLTALAERKGRDYSLWNRRCKCRLKPGCPGWNKFHFLHGVYRLMMDGDRCYVI